MDSASNLLTLVQIAVPAVSVVTFVVGMWWQVGILRTELERTRDALESLREEIKDIRIDYERRIASIEAYDRQRRRSS